MNREKVRNLLKKAGIADSFKLYLLEGGRNNLAYRVQTDSKSYFLKAFYPESAKTRNTFQREIQFLHYAEKIGLSGVPCFLTADSENYLLLSEYIHGRRYSGPVSKADVLKAGSWIKELNSRPVLPDLEQAADSCRCNADHYAGVRKRLKSFIDLRKEELDPFLQHLSHDLDQLEKTPLPECRKQVISPSDFGFHNVLVKDDDFYFIDFEYAGLDDPAKLMCDFFCQPDFPVSISYAPQLLQEIFPEEGDLLKRFEALYPVHRIKWSCILMNSLLPDRGKARLYSGEFLPDSRVIVSRAEEYYGGGYDA